MLFRLYRGCCCFIAGLLALVSCNEPLGYGVFMDFFPQTCESIAVRGVFTDELACCVIIKGKEMPHDPEVEALASDWFYQVHPGFISTPGGSASAPLRYTLNLCTGIRVINDGKDLSALFSVRMSEGSMCWLSKDKQIINVPVQGITVSDFLEFNPLIPAEFELFSDSLPKEEMEGRTFTIELEIDGAETLTSQWIYESFN